MAWAFDSASDHPWTNSVTNPETWSHTVTGSDTLLVVGLRLISTTNCSGVTYNGTAMTELATYSPQIPQTNFRVSYWYLKNPATGTNTVSATLPGTNTNFAGLSMSYTGIEQTPTIENSGGASANRSALEVSLSGLTVGSVIIGIAGGPNYYSSAGTGTTHRITADDGIRFQLFGGDADVTGTTDTINWNVFNDNWGDIAAAFAVSGGGGGGATLSPQFLMFA